MLDHQCSRSGPARLVLLLAGLLYLLGTAAEPLVHLYAGAAQDGAVVAIEGAEPAPDGSGSDVAHGESQCLLCKVASQIVAPQGEPALAQPFTQANGLIAPTSCSRAPPVFSSPQPRAPPHA